MPRNPGIIYSYVFYLVNYIVVQNLHSLGYNYLDLVNKEDERICASRNFTLLGSLRLFNTVQNKYVSARRCSRNV